MKKVMSYLTLFTMIGMIAAMFISISLLGFGVTNELDPTPVRLYLEPAGYAFVIWFFIYLGCLAFGIFQILPGQIYNPRLKKVRVYMIINGLANSVWFLGVIQNQLWLTVICMIILLFTLIQASVHAEIGRATVTNSEVWMVRIPLSIYFGWISVATPINITAYFLDLGWTGQNFLNPEIWSILILLLAIGIVTIVYVSRYANFIYMGVILWALLAIVVANLSASQMVCSAALLGIVLVMLTLTLTLLKQYKVYAVI